MPRRRSTLSALAAFGATAALLVAPTTVPPAAATSSSTIVDSPVDEVIDAAMGPDGTIYAVGGFNEAGPATGGLTRLSSSTAQVDRTFPTVNGRVYAMIVDDSGRTYIGGTFLSVAGQPRASLARLNADGSLDTTWAPPVAGPVFGDPVVNSLALSGTTLFLGGYFTGVSGAARQNAAAVDTITGDALSWAPNPTARWRLTTPISTSGEPSPLPPLELPRTPSPTSRGAPAGVRRAQTRWSSRSS